MKRNYKYVREDGREMEALKGIAGSEGYGTGRAVIISNDIPQRRTDFKRHLTDF